MIDPTFPFSYLAATFLSPRISHAVLSLLTDKYTAATVWNALPLLLSSRLVKSHSDTSSVIQLMYLLVTVRENSLLLTNLLLLFTVCSSFSEVLFLVYLPRETSSSFLIQ